MTAHSGIMNPGGRTKCVVLQKIKCLNVACLTEVVEGPGYWLPCALTAEEGRVGMACKGNLVPWPRESREPLPVIILGFCLRTGLSSHNKGVVISSHTFPSGAPSAYCSTLPSSVLSVCYSSFSNIPAGGWGLRHTMEGFCLKCLSLTQTESQVAKYLGLSVTCLVGQKLEEWMRKLPCL